ncbi:MAG: aldolase [Mesorhizobium sp.]|nr:MAG: aldolase [Mesorhizobium sp.]
MISESEARGEIVRLSKSLFDRGYSVGTGGNISCLVEDGILITPTNSSLGFLDPDRLSKVSRGGRHLSGDKPSKEIFLHRAFYDSRAAAGAVVHLHSTYCTALSCLTDLDRDDCIPALTPYVVMRVGTVRLLPYTRPGDPSTAELISQLGGRFAAVLLGNHGPVVSGTSLQSAVAAAEELEETAKLLMMLRSLPVRLLGDQDVADLRKHFPQA